jgi:hypothetical protein
VQSTLRLLWVSTVTLDFRFSLRLYLISWPSGLWNCVLLSGCQSFGESYCFYLQSTLNMGGCNMFSDMFLHCNQIRWRYYQKTTLLILQTCVCNNKAANWVRITDMVSMLWRSCCISLGFGVSHWQLRFQHTEQASRSGSTFIMEAHHSNFSQNVLFCVSSLVSSSPSRLYTH